MAIRPRAPRRRSVFATVTLVVAIGAITADPALGSTARTVHHPGSCDTKGCSPPYNTAEVLAGLGEANQFLVASADGQQITIRDLGAGISAGDGCVQVSGDTVRCVGEAGVSVDAGDGEDRLDFSGTRQPSSGSGGTGNDVLLASSAGSFLSGGPGRDDLRGGPGRDFLGGGDGEDRLDAGAGDDTMSPDDLTPETDFVDGGPGRDHLRFDHSVTVAGKLVKPSYPLDIDLLRPSPNGAPGENDTLRGVEDISPGTGAVSFAGTDTANSLRGPVETNPARDNRLIGRGGNDDLSWGRLLEGGSGNDELEYGARNHCGPGRDTVRNFPSHRVRVALVDSDCERVEDTVAVADRMRLHLRRRGPLLRYRGACTVRCRITIAVRAARSFKALKGKAPLVNRTSKRAKGGGTIKLAPRLGRRGRRLVARSRKWLKFTLRYRQVDLDHKVLVESESFATTIGPTPADRGQARP